MLITGGGAHNDYLVSLISKKLIEVGVKTTLPSKELIDFKEAILMAYMGYRYLNSEPNVLSSATGGTHDIIAGALYKGNGKEQ